MNATYHKIMINFGIFAEMAYCKVGLAPMQQITLFTLYIWTAKLKQTELTKIRLLPLDQSDLG